MQGNTKNAIYAASDKSLVNVFTENVISFFTM